MNGTLISLSTHHAVYSASHGGGSHSGSFLDKLISGGMYRWGSMAMTKLFHLAPWIFTIIFVVVALVYIWRWLAKKPAVRNFVRSFTGSGTRPAAVSNGGEFRSASSGDAVPRAAWSPRTNQSNGE